MATIPKENDSVDDKAAKAGILPSHGIELDVPAPAGGVRPPNIRHMYGKENSFSSANHGLKDDLT